MQDHPVDHWQMPKISGSGKPISWKTSLFSPKASCQHLWSLLACVLTSLRKECIVMIVGLDEEINLILQEGLKYLLDFSPEGTRLTPNPILQRLLIIGGVRSGSTFQCESLPVRINSRSETEGLVLSSPPKSSNLTDFPPRMSSLVVFPRAACSKGPSQKIRTRHH